MIKYNPKKIESKWQKAWTEKPEISTADDNSDKPKKYVLDMWPYPSGDGLHVGHVESYTATDIMSRYYRMNGFNVIHPQGWDAFGLPAENFAIKTGVHPAETTAKAIATFKKQMNKMGFSYDWSREQNSSDPKYYKWTQWWFLLLHKNGLAYKKKGKVNWCPKCQTVLANEQAEGGICERCKTEVVQKELEQWYFKITDFIEKNKNTAGLLEGLEKVDWPESIKAAQKNWIGKSVGTQFKIKIKGTEESIEVYTTRIDTVFGMTYVVVAPEHPILNNKELGITNYGAIGKYIKESQNKTDLERMETKEKTGVKLEGIKAINPFTEEEIPLFVADYVLGHYGTGAVMAVPAHDERDWEFAKKYDLPIKKVVEPCFCQDTEPGKIKENEPFVERTALTALVKHWEKDEYIALKWKKVAWKTLITGGVEEGQTPEEAARAEVLEETGYKNLKLIEQLPMVHSKFYHIPKKENRFAHFHVFYFELENGDQEKISTVESDIHEVLWVPKDKMVQYFTAESHNYIWQTLGKSEAAYIEEGVLNNSGEYNFLTSKEACEKMTAWLEKNELGKKVANYKLRDWLVSRQRYWGAPIPIIYCDKCAADKVEFKLNINFRKNDVWERIIDGKKTVETRALNPEEKERYFGDVMIGDRLLFSNKNNGERRIFEITEAFRLNLKELFENKELLRSVYGHDGIPESLDELERDYAGIADNYLEKIKKNGLVAWRIKKVALEILVPEKDLPVALPTDVGFKPTGESPLAYSKTFHAVKCPQCGRDARRESDTMDTFVCSSWYYFRYVDPKNEKEFASKGSIKKWLPVDLYVGGAEHAVLHLLYSRFFTKVLHNLGMIGFDEPFLKLRNQGLILAEDGRKMSKSLGNVVNPDQVVEEFGADSLRMFEMFMGPLEDAKPWNTNGIIGLRRFLERVFEITVKIVNDRKRMKNILSGHIHKTIKYVTEDIDNFKFNTAISKLMVQFNGVDGKPDWRNKFNGKEWEDVSNIGLNVVDFESLEKFLILLSPFAPHLAEELWEKLGHRESIFKEKWPEYDPDLIKDEKIKLVVQVNGKVRDIVEASHDIPEEEARELALQSEKIKAFIGKKDIKKIIFVKGRLINIVV